MKRATIRQVAARAGVSPMTVSHAINGRKQAMSAQTYERVLEAVREMNYVPVRTAAQNRHVATNTIGLVPYYRNPSRSIVDSLTFQGICDSASQHGYDLFIMLRGEAEWMANREEVRFLDRRSDGFIFISPGIGEWQPALRALIEHKIPTVVCYRRDVPPEVPWVDPDNEAIINLAVDCLLRQGHSRLVYLSGPKSTVSDNELLSNLSGERASYDNTTRIRHFQERLRALGKKKPEKNVFHISSPYWRMSTQEVESIFEMGATGVICGDVFALQLWDKVEAMGKKVPDDLSIVSIDNQIEAAHRGLTAIGFSYDDLGRAAVQAWMDLYAGGEATDCCKIVPVQLVERASVAAPRSL